MISEFFSRVRTSAAGFNLSNLFNFISEVMNTARLLSSAFLEADSEDEMQVLYKGVGVCG